jgi:predicted secreted protein
MSEIGYNGRSFVIKLDTVKIAAVQSKSVTHTREAIDVTNDDSNGWRVTLPTPAVRAIDLSIEGVATEDNYQLILDEWLGTVNSAVTILNPDGSIESAANGFFIGSVESTGAHDGHVTFTAAFQSSGAVTRTPPP